MIPAAVAQWRIAGNHVLADAEPGDGIFPREDRPGVTADLRPPRTASNAFFSHP